jgi:competence protein ComEA
MDWMNKIKNATSGSDAGKIDLNKMSREQLSKINGIGPVLAGKIVAYREENGRIEDVNELKHIDGVSEERTASVKKQART